MLASVYEIDADHNDLDCQITFNAPPPPDHQSQQFVGRTADERVMSILSLALVKSLQVEVVMIAGLDVVQKVAIAPPRRENIEYLEYDILTGRATFRLEPAISGGVVLTGWTAYSTTQKVLEASIYLDRPIVDFAFDNYSNQLIRAKIR